MNRQEFKDLLSKRVLILDGATGTELQKYNFLEGVSTPEELNIKFPERIEKIYSYNNFRNICKNNIEIYSDLKTYNQKSRQNLE